MWIKIVFGGIVSILIIITLLLVWLYRCYGDDYDWLFWLPIATGGLALITALILLIMIFIQAFRKTDKYTEYKSRAKGYYDTFKGRARNAYGALRGRPPMD